MKSFMLDIDGVLADWTGAYMHLAEVYYPGCSQGYHPTKQIEFASYNGVSLWDERVWDLLMKTDWWWTSLAPLVGQDVFHRIARMSRTYDVYFITNARHDTISPVEQRATWLRTYGIPHPSVICTPLKGRICDALKLDYALEDRLENVQEIHKSSSTDAFLLDRPYNQSNDSILFRRRVKTVMEFLDIMENVWEWK